MLEPKQQETKDSTLLDEEKVPQESEILEDAYDVKIYKSIVFLLVNCILGPSI